MIDLKVPHLATAMTGPLLALEKHVLSHQFAIEAWFRQQWQLTPPPLYSSVDLRNAGFKVAPVDTNLFPAGFNNLNPDFMPLCVQAMQATIAEICPNVTRLLIIPESHTRNQFYFESLAMLQEIIVGAGYEVRIGSMAEGLKQPTHVDLPSGRSVCIEPLLREGDKVGVVDFFPCCIILNNDLSDGVPPILDNVSQMMRPSHELGWVTRLKSEHFRYYESVTESFAQHIDLDPWLITPWFDQCPEVNFMQKQGQQCLMARADALLKRVTRKYQEYKIEQPPFLVIKADQGTYGMAVMMIKDVKELEALNRKQRTRMSTLKGGAPVTRAIIQEGVYSFETVEPEEAVAEPVVYMIGRHVAGGFYRVHEGRRPDENLNAPGMNFKPLAFVEPCQRRSADSKECVNRFYLYGVVSRLAALAAAREMAAFKQGGSE
jgi:glutamate--cysteine ligase